ncbi:hypothetical protein DSLASN_44590 [Desulfoluna limicola]|uniref:Uncharacterized protein n=1 Tax=Desulfoluna limicola TaxID=2810562 RepID=A0ABM7PMR8_9BACT|nr:hypothetical protein [Desulfoluna limicola]BCS98827.1 hypothetical protein DSLASN_44590 [Desulfoluna limicola]
MRKRYRLLFMIIMVMALGFGYLHLFVQGTHNFERLHIFLFNLTSGGTSILYYIENKKRMSGRVRLFLVFSVVFAVLAWLEIFIPAAICGVALAVIADKVRRDAFSFFPREFFVSGYTTASRFAHASVLCLVLGLLTSVFVILNDAWLHLFTLETLSIDTFFLGFSFPVSLITMSVMFSLIPDLKKPMMKVASLFAFWAVNLGVITFFLFIVAGKLWPQVAVTLVLFFTVILIFTLFVKYVKELQQKSFLVSGMLFLLYTAITGIAYILLEIMSDGYLRWGDLLLRLHAVAALYGWNLSGLAVIYRRYDFPIRLNSKQLIAGQWLLVGVAIPLGDAFPLVAVGATVGYGVFLLLMFFSGKIPQGEERRDPVVA